MFIDPQSLKNQPWLVAQASRAVLKALGSAGAKPRFVGGCVRDGLLGLVSKDIDIAINQLPEDNMCLLKQSGIRVAPSGLKYGTITALAGSQKFEITTLRVDVKNFGRGAEVAFTENWYRDAQRRDFTINAIYADDGGQIYDPVSGLADLAKGKVRFVGDALERIKEDKLRIMRFFRFQCVFGEGIPDAAAMNACAFGAEGIDTLSRERVRDELFKLLAVADPLPGLQLMAVTGVLEKILPNGFNLKGLAKSDHDPLRRLSIVAKGEEEAIQNISRILQLSIKQADRLHFLMKPPIQLRANTSIATLRQLLYDYGTEKVSDLILQQGIINLLPKMQNTKPPYFPLSGKDVLAFGVSDGPLIGNILRSMEASWREKNFSNSREELLGKLADICDSINSD